MPLTAKPCVLSIRLNCICRQNFVLSVRQNFPLRIVCSLELPLAAKTSCCPCVIAFCLFVRSASSQQKVRASKLALAANLAFCLYVRSTSCRLWTICSLVSILAWYFHESRWVKIILPSIAQSSFQIPIRYLLPLVVMYPSCLEVLFVYMLLKVRIIRQSSFRLEWRNTELI